MNAVWVSHFPVFGGPHNLVRELAGPLSERGWETTMLLPLEPGSAAARLRDGRVAVDQVRLRRLRWTLDPRPNLGVALGFRSDVREIRKVIRARAASAVVLTGLTNPQAAIAARSEGVAVVWQILDSRNPPLLRSAAMRLVRRYADAVMFDGIALERLHLGGQPLGVPSFQFTPVVDLRRFRSDPEHRVAARKELGVPPDALFVGTVANLNPMKGVEYFIRAASLIYQRRPDAYFMVSGASYPTHRDYEAAVLREIEASGIPGERWRRRREPPDMHYPALDMKLVTSLPRSEGTTTTALESFACGTPVIAADVGAVSEVVEDEVTGLIVPPLNPEALATATLRLADEPELARRLGEAGRRRAEDRFGPGLGADVHARALEAASSRRASGDPGPG